MRHFLPVRLSPISLLHQGIFTGSDSIKYQWMAGLRSTSHNPCLLTEPQAQADADISNRQTQGKLFVIFKQVSPIGSPAPGRMGLSLVHVSCQLLQAAKSSSLSSALKHAQDEHSEAEFQSGSTPTASVARDTFITSLVHCKAAMIKLI